MELRQSQTFVTITQTESFSRAAEVLGYTQSALTVQIRLLENELGVKLFDRMGKRVYLTAPGRQFLGHANQIIRDIKCAREFAKARRSCAAPSCGNTGIPVFFKASPDTEFLSQRPIPGFRSR
ncbi:MAG: LysR family transcriptional regulator [Acutalibacteraceae bacterium]